VLDLLDAGLPPPARGVFTTRQGGVSARPWDSLDLAVHVDDDPRHVAHNRSLVAAQLGVSDVAYAQQVHGSTVTLVHGASRLTTGVAGTDALVTTTPGLALAILGADCLPVLIAGEGVVGAAHVGRGGLVAGVLHELVRVMRRMTDGALVATPGPGICGGCYEVPEVMAAEAAAAVPGCRSVTGRGTAGIDLLAGAHAQLAEAGVKMREPVGGCTFEQPDRFYSHRRDGLTGRHGGMVWLG
jgi:YfiH family protein